MQNVLRWSGCALSSLLGLASCSNLKMPDGEGAGLVNVVPAQPPAGVETLPRPTLKLGDRFVFEMGGVQRLPMRVILADDKLGYQMLDESSGMITTYDPDLGMKGAGLHKRPETVIVRAPTDVGFSWPLWRGKQWTCVYVQKGPRIAPEEVLATYVCDGEETIKVPAGEFRCLRIWRRSHLTQRKGFYQQSILHWYAPKVGFWVRRVVDGVETVLVQVQRQ